MSEQEQSLPEIQTPARKRVQIAEYYEVQIRRGTIGPGEKLPSAREISQLWKVSIESAHGAIKILKEKRLVTTNGRHGTRAI